MKLLVAAFGALALCATMLASRRPKLVLLFAWVVSLTYNRQYFVFEGLAGDNGAQGPYLIVSDLFLLALFAIWGCEAAILKKIQRLRTPAIHTLFLPFAFAGLVSALGAERPDWSLYELLRVAKVIAIFLYVRYNFTKEEWWTSAAAMTFAAVFQGGLGTAEVATQRSGLMGVLGLSRAADDIPEELRPENFYGWFRATATMNHPPNLACYLLLTFPLPVAVALSNAPARLRAVAALAGLVALVGLACTLSRWPWLLAVVQVVFLTVTLTFLRAIPVRRTLGIVVVGVFAATLSLLPFTDFIADRMTRDLTRSVEFREHENEVALAMFADHPVTGVGLNNYILHLATYRSEMVWALDPESTALAIKRLRVRFIAAPQNGFLLPLAETGITGLFAFLFYLVAALFVSVRAMRSSVGWHAAVMVGLTAGILGVVGQQIMDYSFWVDPVFYTFTLAVAMLAASPVLGVPSAARAS